MYPGGKDAEGLTDSEQSVLLNGRGSNDISTVDGISKKVYQQTQETWALCDLLSVRLAGLHIGSVTLPDWALKVLYEKLMSQMLEELHQSEGVGQTAKKSTKALMNRRHAARYLQVRELHGSGQTYEEAYERVADLSGDSPLEKKQISAKTVKNSDLKVRKDIKQGGTKFYIPVTFSVREILLSHLIPK
ncbi:MAG: hypothetical protein JKX72_12590 [Robiginitomaculum sp.]|nr:hypothetical protein [Robiginitomaculum sp.]